LDYCYVSYKAPKRNVFAKEKYLAAGLAAAQFDRSRGKVSRKRFVTLTRQPDVDRLRASNSRSQTGRTASTKGCEPKTVFDAELDITACLMPVPMRAALDSCPKNSASLLLAVF